MLDGRTILVTGASTGIGRTTALFLAANGATVIAGVRDTTVDLGPDITTVRLDITNAEHSHCHHLDASSTTPDPLLPSRRSRSRSTALRASKFALEALSDSLRREQRDVAVVLVEPGAIATPIWTRGIEAATRSGTRCLRAPTSATRSSWTRSARRPRSKATAGDPPETVARVIATALTTHNPRTRYVVGRDARIQAILGRVLPARAIDKLLARLSNN